MKGSGVDPKIGVEFAGSILEQSTGKESVDELMGHFSKSFNIAEKGRVPLSRAVPELSQIMSMGVSAEDAAKMYAIVSPAAAGQEGTAVQAALRRPGDEEQGHRGRVRRQGGHERLRVGQGVLREHRPAAGRP